MKMRGNFSNFLNIPIESNSNGNNNYWRICAMGANRRN